MVHGVRLIPLQNTLHLEVSYRRPVDPLQYEHEVSILTKKINEFNCSDFFTCTILNYPTYPDFLVIDGDVIDIPVYINLQMDV